MQGEALLADAAHSWAVVACKHAYHSNGVNCGVCEQDWVESAAYCVKESALIMSRCDITAVLHCVGNNLVGAIIVVPGQTKLT